MSEQKKSSADKDGVFVLFGNAKQKKRNFLIELFENVLVLSHLCALANQTFCFMNNDRMPGLVFHHEFFQLLQQRLNNE